MQFYIRRCFIVCVCKILSQKCIIKDILKKKTNVHWIPVRTVVLKGKIKKVLPGSTIVSPVSAIVFVARQIYMFIVLYQSKSIVELQLL